MYSRFLEYKNIKETQEFNEKFEELCEEIAINKIEFYYYWNEHFVPSISKINTSVSNVEILNEFIGRIRNWFKNRNQPELNPDEMAREQARQKNLANYQRTFDQHTDKIRQRFLMAMRDFLNKASEDAKSENDPHLLEIIKRFYTSIMKVAEPAMNSFKIKAIFSDPKNPAQYMQNFQKIQQQRAPIKDAQQQQLKKRLQQNNPEKTAALQSEKEKFEKMVRNDIKSLPYKDSPKTDQEINAEVERRWQQELNRRQKVAKANALEKIQANNAARATELANAAKSANTTVRSGSQPAPAPFNTFQVSTTNLKPESTNHGHDVLVESLIRCVGRHR